jgi:predicted DNA-binding protein
MARKMTFTLDDQTVRRIEQAASRTRKAKSAIIREAVADYADRVGKLSEAERQRMLRIIRELVPKIPRKPAKKVDEELEQIRAARRAGGRKSLRRGRR